MSIYLFDVVWPVQLELWFHTDFWRSWIKETQIHLMKCMFIITVNRKQTLINSLRPLGFKEYRLHKSSDIVTKLHGVEAITVYKYHKYRWTSADKNEIGNL